MMFPCLHCPVGVEWNCVVDKLERCGFEEGRGKPSRWHGDEEMGILSSWALNLIHVLCAVFASLVIVYVLGLTLWN